MSRGEAERLGVAVVTAWLEPGPPPVLKVRVTTRRGGVGDSFVTAEPAAAGEYIRNWLVGFDVPAARASGARRCPS